MAQNLEFDPATKDYVVENGSPVETDNIDDAAYIALTIPNGQWLYGTPEQGSLLFTLKNRKRTGSIEQQFSSYTTDAIKRQLIATGQATQVQVSNLQTTRTGTSNNVAVTPNTSQLSSQLNFNAV